MSIRVMSQVWEHSQQQGSALLVLLAIADFADDDGYAYPSVERLAAKARMSPRNVRYVLRQLEESGELAIEAGGGRHRVNGYRVQIVPRATAETVQVVPGKETETVQCVSGKKIQGKSFTEKPRRETLQDSAETLQSGAETLQPVAAEPSLTVIKNRQKEPSRRGARSGRAPSPSSPPPEAEPPPPEVRTGDTPFALFLALCEELGADPVSVAKAEKSRQLGHAKWLLEQGYDEARVRGCLRYLRSQPWRTSPIDLGTVRSEIGKWELNGSPPTAEPRASPRSRGRSGSLTARQIADMALAAEDDR